MHQTSCTFPCPTQADSTSIRDGAVFIAWAYELRCIILRGLPAQQMDLRNGAIRKKYDALKYTLRKMEQTLYELSLAEAGFKRQEDADGVRCLLILHSRLHLCFASAHELLQASS